MSEFTRYDTSLQLQYHQQASLLLGGDYWMVCEPFVYHIDRVGSQSYVTVPTGFLTDGASVPRTLWSILPPWGDHGQAAVLHDYLCEYGYITDGIQRISITRKRADDLFLQAMEVLQVSKYKRRLMSMGVNWYRRVMKPPMPSEVLMKTHLSDMIMENYRTTGSTLLTTYQINYLKQRYNVLGQ